MVLILNEQVDNPTCEKTPKKRAIAVPTLASIEELRSPAFEDLVEKLSSLNKSSKGTAVKAEGKKQLQQQFQLSPNRSPFAALN